MNEIKEKENNSTLVFSDELESLLSFIKNDLSKELPTLVIDTDYFILGVLGQKNNYLYKRLDSCLMSASIDAIYNTFYQVVSSKALSAVKSGRKVNLDATLADALAKGESEARDMGSSEVTSEHVFLGIMSNTDDNNKIRKVFNKAGLTYGIMRNKMTDSSNRSEADSDGEYTPPKASRVKIIHASSEAEAKQIINKILNNGGDPAMEGTVDDTPRKKKGKNPYIKTYCLNLNDEVKCGRIEKLVGRERETKEIIRILGRMRKNNAILVGSEGVGKTAIGENIAYKIVNDDVPEFLLGKTVVSLNMTSLMAGTTLRGMFEERVEGLINEIKADKSIILFMDNIGAILADNGKNDYDISSMLSTALEKGDIQVIGTSDFASYRKTFDKDPSLARRFQKIIVEKPTIDESLNILRGIKSSYENYHKVKYDDDAVEACVQLANFYISERNLPDSAIDLLDEAGATIGTLGDNETIRSLKNKVSEIEKQIADKKSQEDFKEADELSKELVLTKQNLNSAKAAYDKELSENPPVVTKQDIMSIVSEITNIPTSNLTADDKKNLSKMNERLKENVIGQDDAIDTICKALKRNRVGLRKNGCMFSSILIGKSGVGKTLIAKQLAKELFGNEKALVRFDMSEFSDKVSVNKLIGSNPGYIGYEEGGQLTEAIKNKKHCVLLLDEIEKADPEVYNIFLQVLDEGFLTDNSGMKVDFKNVIVLFTSNVGAKTASEFGKGIGFKENEGENTRRILLKQLKNRFPPEFLNRLDDVIYFNNLSDDNLKRIIGLEMNKLQKKVKEIGFELSYDNESVDYLLNTVKEEKEYGARPVIRAIQDSVEDKITDLLLDNKYQAGHKFKVSSDKKKNQIIVN